MAFYSPLRYPGGKHKIVKFIHEVIKTNSLEDGFYIEPYAGGASIALWLLIEKKVSSIIINDYDKSIYAFWHCVLNRTDDFCRKIQRTPITIANWYKQKKIQKDKKGESLFRLGFSTFFLNRTNRSGIISGGPIGGLKQEGEWKIYDRFNKKALIKRIRVIAKHKKQIKIYNLDALKLINDIFQELPKKVLIYFDPPYYVKGKGLYVNHYAHKDHALVAKTIKKLSNKNVKWIVSYDNVEEIKNLYKGCQNITYDLNYSVINGSIGSEIMFFSNNLLINNKFSNSDKQFTYSINFV